MRRRSVHIFLSLMVEYSTPFTLNRRPSSRRCHRQSLGGYSLLITRQKGKESRTLIRLALLSELTSCFDGRFASMFVQIRVAHDLAANELVLKVGVDNASRLRRLRALTDGPRTHFSGTACEIPDQLSARADIITVKSGCVCILRGEGELTSREVYPAWVILPSALEAPAFFSSSAFSSAGKGARRSSRATEKGMSGSPGLLASIHALIRGSLGEVCMSHCG